LFSRGKKKLKVELADLTEERESLASFLRKTLKVDVTSDSKNLLIDSQELSPEDLKKLVNKFIYHHRLNNKYWVALEGDGVRISKLKEMKKNGKRKKEAVPPSTIKHGW
jgi:hypothetical protein